MPRYDAGMSPRPSLLVLALGLLLPACGGSEDLGSPPIAELRILVAGVERDAVDLGTAARLDATRSSDPDEDIAQFRFTVADGSGEIVTTQRQLDHLFKLAGQIEISLEVTDRKGNRDSVRKQVAVRRP